MTGPMTGFEAGTTLHTGRLMLRPPRADDADGVFAAVDAEVRRWMPWAQGGYTRDQALDWCVRLAHQDPAHATNFAMTATGRLAGWIGLSRANWVDGRAEIGYWLAPWARKRGYATEAVTAVCAYGFATGLHRIELLAATGNHASQRVAERAGFTREGVLREAELHARGRVDLVLFGLLSRELPGSGASRNGGRRPGPGEEPK